MLTQEIAIGMVILTTLIHSFFMVGGIKLGEWRLSRFGGTGNQLFKASLLMHLKLIIF